MPIKKIDNEAEAVRFFNFPYAAIEESLVNAIYHRSYEIREPVTVTLTAEGLEIKSFPGPGRYITDEDLADGHIIGQRYRNRKIGDYLRELKLAEGRNTGIAKIIGSMRKNGSPAPLFLSDSDRCHFSVFLPVHDDFLPEKSKNRKKSPRRSGEQLRHDILSQLAERLGYPMATSSLRSAVRTLMEEGRIEYTHSSMRAPNQKLRIRI